MIRSFALALLVACGGDEEVVTLVDDCDVPAEARGVGCTAVGVQQCADGFAADGRGGCDPILPAEPCAPGELAVPGDTACREVAACPENRFGEAPREPDTRYVDAAYTGGASDGSERRPFTTIQEAIDAAVDGAAIAIAAGSYVEDVEIDGKRVRLWGRCPGLVEVRATGGMPTQAIFIARTQGAEVHTLAVTSPIHGIGVTGATEILFDRVWLHDTAQRGFLVQDDLGETSFIVRDSLVERTFDYGFYLSGTSVTLERSVIRDTFPRASDGTVGRGLSVEHSSLIPRRGGAVVRQSLIERNGEAGVAAIGADVTIEDTVIRDTWRGPLGDMGRGIHAAIYPGIGATANLTLSGSLLERNHDLAIVVLGASADISSTVVRDTYPTAAGTFGAGIGVLLDRDTYTPASATLRDSVVERGTQTGVFFASASGSMSGMLVRDIAPQPADDFYGDAVVAIVAPEPDMAPPMSLEVSGSRLERSARAGIANFGAAVSVGSTRFECNAIDLNGELFSGVPFTMTDNGENLCTCNGTEIPCRVLSNDLLPPGAL